MAQPKVSILYITLHSFDRLSFVLLVYAWKQGYRIRQIAYSFATQNVFTEVCTQN